MYVAAEAGLRSEDPAGTTGAPVGQAPVVTAAGARHRWNMLSAVTAQRQLRFATYSGSFTAARFVVFCTKLLADTNRPVSLVVDGHPTHKANTVQQFVASTDGRLTLVVRPAYSPPLTRDEGVWTNVQHDRIGRTSAHSADESKTKIVGALRRLQKLPELVRGFFRNPDLGYITA